MRRGTTLEADACNGETFASFSQRNTPWHAPFGLVEQAEGSALSRRYLQRELRVSRNAKFFAHGEVEFELEPDGPRGIDRADHEGENDIAVIADRLRAALVDETHGCGPFEVDRREIFRARPVEE